MHGLVISIQVNVHILLNKLRVFQILWHSKAQTSKEKYISNLHTSLKTLKFIKRIDVLIIPGKKDKKQQDCSKMKTHLKIHTKS